ncbi:MAG: alpha-glucan family phosphorylase [Acidimicrobiia bacterium]
MTTNMTTRSELESLLVATASNYSWTWDRQTQDLFAALPPSTAHLHPRQRVAALGDADYDRLLNDQEFITSAQAARARVPEPTRNPDAQIAYFSPEFGVSEKLPQYSGGLGVLAGDHLKAASDLDLPLVAVGLFYRDGFFHQTIIGDRQREVYERTDPRSLGLEQTHVIVDIVMDDRVVKARVWRADVGRTKLYLLDTDLELNDERGKWVSDRLYSGDREHRIRQELLMGVGGVRALRQLGYEPGVFHLNEGHAGFLALELIGEEVDRGLSLSEAIEAVRPKIVFTTHTPVPAGIDRFAHDLMERYLGVWSERYGVSIDELLDLAHMPGEPDSFNMAAFCLRISGRANGVSRLHGEVSREMFGEVPGGSEITSVTNGVHARTWVANDMQGLFEEALGSGWGTGVQSSWTGVDDIANEDLRRVRKAGRRSLIDLVDDRVGHRHNLQPDVLTIGFARRFATYKRADLLLRDMESLESLLAEDERRVQFVFAGKAHPADEGGKEILHRIAEFSKSDASQGRFVLIPDYEMAVAKRMYAGCDVWLNNPVRPNEACGTSGEKAALNGGLNLSVLDGWWDECFDGSNGWEIETSDVADRSLRDSEEAAALHTTLSSELLPLFYDGSGGSKGPSDAWLSMVRRNWKTLGPFVSAARMVNEYDERLYRPRQPS